MARRNPFTPGSGLAPPHLANREREIEAFRDSLQATLDGTPRHLAVFGAASLGKTSLLLTFRRMAFERGCLVVLGSPYATDDAESFTNSIIRALILQIQAFYRESIWNDLVQALGLHDRAVSTLDASLRSHSALSGDAPTTLRNHLRIIWDHAQDLVPAMLIMVDDVDHFQDPNEAITVLKRAFTELSMDNVNAMAVITSAADRPTAETVAPLERFFTSVHLNRLSDEAIMDALTVPIAGTPLRLSQEVTDRIVELAAGNPYYLQELAYHTIEMTDLDHRVTPHTFELALEQTFYRISVPHFEPRISSLSEDERNLLAVLIHLDPPASLSEIVRSAAPSGHDDIAVADLLESLAAKGCIARASAPSAEPHYAVLDPLFREYVRRHLDWIP